MKKSERLAAITSILKEQEISTQQELTQALADQGIQLTQATVSRLMAELGVVKFPAADGRFYYGFPSQAEAQEEATIGQDMVLAISQQGSFLNIVVVPGTSRLLKKQLLEQFAEQIFSLLADDDSLFLVANSEKAAGTVADGLRQSALGDV